MRKVLCSAILCALFAQGFAAPVSDLAAIPADHLSGSDFSNEKKLQMSTNNDALNHSGLEPYSSSGITADLKRLETVLSEAKKRAQPYNLPQHDFRQTALDVVEPIDFFGSNFQGANFSGTAEAPKKITNIDFSECNLKGANFSYTIITKCTFQKSQLNQANFTGSRIRYGSFREALLEEANMSQTDQESVGYDAADLRKSVWTGAVLFRVSFTQADERGWQRKDVQEKDCSHQYAKK